MATKAVVSLSIYMKDLLPKLFGFGEDSALKAVAIANAVVSKYEDAISELSETLAAIQATLAIFRILFGRPWRLGFRHRLRFPDS